MAAPVAPAPIKPTSMHAASNLSANLQTAVQRVLCGVATERIQMFVAIAAGASGMEAGLALATASIKESRGHCNPYLYSVK